MTTANLLWITYGRVRPVRRVVHRCHGGAAVSGAAAIRCTACLDDTFLQRRPW